MTAFATVDSGRPLKIVQVGAGGMGRAWLRAITADPLVELVGLVDLDLDTARRALAEEGIPGEVALGTSAAAIAAETGADAVVNVTVPVAHLPVNLEALDAGLPVLCEKPAAPTLAQAYKQAAVAEKHGQLLMISQSRRYYAALDAARASLPEIGPVSRVSTRFAKGPHFGGFREEMDHVLLVDMAIHQFDAARSLIGTDPLAVYCKEANPEWSWYAGAADAHAIFEFEGGARYVFTGSWIARGEETSWNGEWIADGENGTVRWNGERDVTLTRTGADPEPVSVDTDVPEEIAGSLREFVASLRSGERPQNTAAENVHSLAMVFAATRSAETGQRVSIPEILAEARAEAVEAEQDPELRAILERV
ncbi:dehydrogenase [Microbacterium sorbitolivorans]|nr:Gfo/Idh/MocA family oxidoreductase [Microbacterium sorbitolivorans]GGF38391.1 dehydrogenase [Microbacterium sorbitolivorans]